MELTLLLLLTFITGTIGALFLLYQKLNFWHQQGTLIPHLKPLSLSGNTMFVMILRKVSMPEFISQVYNRFPEARYFGMMEFNKPVIVLRDPELIKNVCVKSFDNFCDHNSFVDEQADPIFGKALFSLRGDRWREMRNTLSPSFTASKMKIIFQLVSKCSLNFVDYFLDHPEETDSVEMKGAFTRYTNDVIATVAFGISVDSIKNKDNEFYLRGKELMRFFSSFLGVLKIVIYRIFPKLMKFIGEPFLPRATDRFFKEIVRETVKTREEKKIIRPDMIHLLMEARDKDNGVELSIDDIVSQALIFFLAGFSGTATLMGFVAHELAVNPEIQEKLRDEVDSFTKQEGKDITYDTLFKMKYLDMVVSETLRKYPPAAMMDRLCVKEYTFPKSTPESEEFIMKPNMLISLPIYAIHHDEQYFPDPEKFDPERFSDENKDAMNPYTYIPFGLGPRKCIGDRFALMETKVLFVHILQNFVLEKAEKTKHPLVFEKGFNVAVDGDFCVKFVRRVVNL